MTPESKDLIFRPSAQFRPIPAEAAFAAQSQRKNKGVFLSRRQFFAGTLATAAVSTAVVQYWDDVFLKRFAEVVPGQLYRAAWQKAWPIARLVDTYQIRSILSLSIMGTTDPKYTNYASVVKKNRLDWVLMPIRGSYMDLAQMAEAADFIESLPRPLLFHCVAGHHRTTQAHAAWRMRHNGYSAAQAWSEICQYRWTNPTGDVRDHSLVERFAASAYINKGYRYEPTAFDAISGPGNRRLAGA